MLDLSVIVPARNAEDLLDDCLASIFRSAPRETLLVDGMSTDRTLEIARRYPLRILSDEGRGLPAARLIGAQAATSRFVALVDADVVLPPRALADLVDEFIAGDYQGLQAGLESVSGPGYWGQALAHHHRSGRSRDWFGVVATIFERETLLKHGFDLQFASGEDIELRWRLQASGARLGVSRRTVVTHRFRDTFEFARAQWLADGQGLGRLISKHGARAGLVLAWPLAAGVRGIGLSLARRQPRWIPYYMCFVLFNYIGMLSQLARGLPTRAAEQRPSDQQA
jgi:glycosyltransferase involved in cell wall biosynthesis